MYPDRITWYNVGRVQSDMYADIPYGFNVDCDRFISELKTLKDKYDDNKNV